MGKVTIDLITRNPAHGGWSMVLVEEGPWPQEQIATNLRRLQERLYNCVDAALDGKLAKQFPESSGKPIVIRLDAYNVPEQEVKEFFGHFAHAVPQSPDYAAALASSNIVPSISFELSIGRA